MVARLAVAGGAARHPAGAGERQAATRRGAALARTMAECGGIIHAPDIDWHVG
ncbi:hypothetical protein ACNKHS_25560 [Shigella flexneri]